MKHFFTLLLALLLTMAPVHGGWFDHEEKQRRIEAEQQLQQQRQATGQWQFAADMLGFTCVVLLVVGVAIGSKARKGARDGTTP